MDIIDYSLSNILLENFDSKSKKLSQNKIQNQLKKKFTLNKINFLSTLKNWLNNLEIKSPVLAHRICQLIPTQCPFEREISLFGIRILNIPPLCKINPFYDELVFLRFRAMSYLADECDQDVSIYC